MMQLIKKFAKKINEISGDENILINVYRKDNENVVFMNTVVNNHYVDMDTQFYWTVAIIGSDEEIVAHRSPRDLMKMDAYERERGKHCALQAKARKTGKVWAYAPIGGTDHTPALVLPF